MREALAAEAPAGDLRFHSGLAGSYKEMAVLCEMAAARAKADIERTTRFWQEARSWYQRSLDVWLDLERRGVTAPSAARDEVVKQIAKCDAEIAQVAKRRSK